MPVFLLFLLGAYTAFGAFVFVSLEALTEERLKRYQKAAYTNQRAQLLDDLADQACVQLEEWPEGPLWPNSSRNATEQALAIETCKIELRRLANATLLQYDDVLVNVLNVSLPDVDQRDWTFDKAAFFAMTLHTTVGYGNIACKTWEGRLASMLYSIIGIPLCMVTLAKIGVGVDFVFRRAYLVVKR